MMWLRKNKDEKGTETEVPSAEVGREFRQGRNRREIKICDKHEDNTDGLSQHTKYRILKIGPLHRVTVLTSPPGVSKGRGTNIKLEILFQNDL